MKVEIDYKPIFKDMGKIIRELVKQYAVEDFKTDREIIMSGGYGMFSWFVGETGTHLYQIAGQGLTSDKREYARFKAQCCRDTCIDKSEFLIMITADGKFSIKLISKPVLEIVAV